MYEHLEKLPEHKKDISGKSDVAFKKNTLQHVDIVDNREKMTLVSPMRTDPHIVQNKTESPIQLKNGKGKKDAQNPQEELIKKAFESLFDALADVKGAGGAGADIAIQDAQNIWMTEAKGKGNKWMSSDNIDKKGNVPSKQLVNRLKGFLKQEITVTPNQSDEKENVTIQDYIVDSDFFQKGYANILLGSTGIDVDDSLIGVTVTREDEGGEVSTKHEDFNPLTVKIVLSFIEDALKIKSEKDLKFTKGDYLKIENSWLEYKGNAREWFIDEPENAHELEQIYTKARKLMEHEIRDGKKWGKLEDSDEKEIRLLPVVSIDKYIKDAKKLKSMKVTQPKFMDTVVHQLSGEVLQLKKFKDDEEASTWLLAKMKLEMPGEGEEYAYFTKYLKLDSTYSPDLQANIGILYGVLASVKEVIELEAQTKGLTKQRTLTGTQKNHVLNGELKSGTITGGHSRSGCEANGFTVTKTKNFSGGFYEGTLSHKDAKKDKTSSFFPDSWSKADIIIAIEYAVHEIKSSKIYVIKSTKGTGNLLFDNGDSVFPYFE